MNFFNRFFNIARYDDSIEQDRVRLIYGTTLLLLLLYTVFATFVINPARGMNLWQLAGVEWKWGIYLTVFYGTALLSLWAVRNGYLRLAAFGPVLMWYMAAVVDAAILNHFVYILDGFTLVGLVLLAGLLNRERGLLIATPLAIATLAAGIALRVTDPNPVSSGSSIYTFITFSLELIGVGLIVLLFLRTTRLSHQQGVAQADEELRLAGITTAIAGRISRRLALDDVLNGAVEQIRDNYPDIYHAQIFLIDERRQDAQLVASTGQIGRLLMERHHSLPVGSQSVIGRVTDSGQTVIARANSQNSVHRRNEFLPDTVVEAAFPLRLGDTIIGALDMQSKIMEAFRDEDVPIFQSLADNIAIAIDNARLFEETERRLHENQLLVEQMRASSEDVQRLNRQLTGRFWEEYLSDKTNVVGLQVDFTTKTVQPDNSWTPALQDAVNYNQVVQERQDGAQIIAVPLRVRGQIIGAMEFELDESGHLSPEDLTLIEEVGEQLGLVAETSRLFEASQRAAQREALVNEIATRLQASNNVEMTLNEAARSLKNSLRAQKVVIRLGAPPKSVVKEK
jgi:GAF domain-containing protein